MSYLSDIEQEPYRFDFLDVARRIERTLGRAESGVREFGEVEGGVSREIGPRPRIGDSASRREEALYLDGREHFFSFGQEPHLEFPASNVARVDLDRETTRRRLRIYCKFLGLLGPQGPLPYALTEEAWTYAYRHDDAFARFLDVFNQRFLQLFFRAWADSSPIVQSDRPDFDRFRAYVLTTIGIGSPAYAQVEHVPAGIGLYAGLLGSKVKSASRLRNAIRGLFGVAAEIEQFVGSWLQFEDSDRSMLGATNSTLGADLMIGAASFSVQDKFRIRIFVRDLAEYRRYLPGGERCAALVDLVQFYLGERFEWDIELAIPARLAPPAVLGAAGALGWSSWMAPDPDADGYRKDARFNAAERIAFGRRKQT